MIASRADEDIGWISRHLGEKALLKTVVYTVDDPDAENTVPANKGNEVMVYLTHMIDNYDNLSDVILFMHAHQITWHNNDLLDSDSAKMVRHLSVARVIREGYMNMRCHLDPGCPAHIRPLAAHEDINVPEAVIIGRAWTELFPDQRIPDVLSQACCAQLALSRDRIHTHPRERYIFLRDWLLNTDLENNISGRIFEYVWQYLWTGAYEFCPKEHICYCDGYGICFGGEDAYAAYFELEGKRDRFQREVENLQDDPEGDPDDSLKFSMDQSIARIEQELSEMKERAFERGNIPRYRALEVGRQWHEGDGF